MANAFQDAALDSVNKIKNGVDREGLSFLQSGPQDTTMDYGLTPSSLVYSSAESSFSGTDCVVSIVYNEHIVILGNVETVSYSIHRDKAPVRTLGRTYAKNYTRGQRTIAGSLIFVQFDESPLYKLYEFFNKKLENAHRFSSPLSDEIPPFDMMLMFSNEYGFNSIIRLYGIEIVDEGATFSINDIYSENVMQFIAKDIDPMVSSGKKGSFQRLLYQRMTQGKILDEHYNSMLKYRQKLETDLANVQLELKSVSGAGRNLRQRSTERAVETNDEIYAARALYNKINGKADRIKNEIIRMNDSIIKYEKTKMTWDLNSSQESNYAGDTAIFPQDN